MLKHRLLMSALLIPATIGLFVWDQHLGDLAPILFTLALLLSARCVWELATLLRAAGYQPERKMILVGTWLMIAAAWWPHYCLYDPSKWRLRVFEEPMAYIAAAWAAVVVMLLLNAVRRFSKLESTKQASALAGNSGYQVATLGMELFGVTYIGGLLSLTCLLRWMPYSWIPNSRGIDGNMGYFPLSALLVATKMGDVGAYTFGRLIGGPKMTPKLSPGKTWAGGVGHLVTAGLCSVIWLCWLGPSISHLWHAYRILPAALFGVVVGFAGLIGDLAESLIKRDVGVKDAPALLPGFGGLLDLMDSILLAGPVAYAMWHLLK